MRRERRLEEEGKFYTRQNYSMGPSEWQSPGRTFVRFDGDDMTLVPAFRSVRVVSYTKAVFWDVLERSASYVCPKSMADWHVPPTRRRRSAVCRDIAAVPLWVQALLDWTF